MTIFILQTAVVFKNLLIFNNTQQSFKFNITLNGKKLEQTNNTKYLGIIIDDKLNWKSHIQKLKSKLASQCYALTKLKPYVDEATLKMVYYSLIYPHLQYCISTWGSASPSNLEPIVTIHKRIVRKICGQPATSHTNPLFAHLKILKLDGIYKLQLAKLMHKYKNNDNLGQHCSTRLIDKHNINDRLSGKGNYFMPRPRTNLGLRRFCYTGPKLWQTVPTEYKELSFPLLKKKYKQFLIDCYLSII